jgi:gamma-glutamylcyclotransferase (GGCT)/AIG2-like uncharacterized protein YtfP
VPSYYFAYGSNMAESVMSGLVPEHRVVGRAELLDHRLAFTRRSIRTGSGVADVVPEPGATVWGTLYELGAGAFAALDRKEGAGWAYERVPVQVRLEGETGSVAAETYRVAHPEPREVTPCREYVEGLVGAARARGLPEAYVADLVGVQEGFGYSQPETGQETDLPLDGKQG